MRVEVWKCSKSGALIENTIDWRRHLCRKAVSNFFVYRRRARLKEAEKCIEELQRCRSFDEICKWLETNVQLLALRQLLNHNIQKDRWQGQRKTHLPVVKNVKLTGARWSFSQSNTHCAPKGKSQNFGRKDGTPTGYPGYRARMSFDLDHGGYDFFPSNILTDTGIHAGSGSGDGVTYQCEVTLFAEEWPYLVFHDDVWYKNGCEQYGYNETVIFEGKLT